MGDDDRRSAEVTGRDTTEGQRACSRNVGREHAGMPRWVRVLLLIGAVLVVLVIVMLLTGHGPGQHMHNMSTAPGTHLVTGSTVFQSPGLLVESQVGA